ncbi:hypothetical protein BJ322DRAFT_1105314 [Thelephora terrestris]|uniref:Uncharacterized protein n=1 Tax=Thelephora terrestris TaxID=56493 RepID=A0A9P6L9J1_9AGAM|nr:hypothetical protein BJ322DRAFT_1105314 [Thelephora terrestris]
MKKLVRCVCKSHCRPFNPDTLSFEGDGALVHKSTAYNHRLDDQMAESLDTFAGNVAARVLGPPPPIDLSDPELVEGVSDEETLLEMELAYRCSWTPTEQALIFVSTPSPHCKYQFPSINELHLCNRGTYALKPGHRANEVYLENESRLCEILIRLRELPSTGTRELEPKVQEGLLRMRRHKEVEWNKQRTYSIARQNGYTVVDASPYFCASLPTDPILSASLLTILLLHLFFRTSRRATTVMIAGIHCVLLASQVSKQYSTNFPRTPGPSCTSWTWTPEPPPIYNAPLATHSTRIQEREVSSALMIKSSIAPTAQHQKAIPVARPYGGSEWVARLLSRPGVEEVLDAATNSPTSDQISDVWGSPVFRGFLDKDKTRFFAKHGNNARFAFSLGADSFHPLGSLEAKQVLSATEPIQLLFPHDPWTVRRDKIP